MNFLDRSAVVYADRTSVVYGPVTYTWRQTRDRCVRVASALSQLGISSGDVVSVLAPNGASYGRVTFRCSHGWSLLCTLNIRHDSALVSVLLKHSETKVLFADHQELARFLSKKGEKVPLLVLIQEPLVVSGGNKKRLMGVRRCCLHGEIELPSYKTKDECDAISLNYTAGTTSSPKGVVYSHRGAYLNSLATGLLNEMHSSPTYLWTNPMFTATAGAYSGVLPRLVGVTHMGGAPTILNMIVNASDPRRSRFRGRSWGSLCSIRMVNGDLRTGTVCAWKPEWDLLPSDRAGENEGIGQE
ncbi:hypothetical protein HID58_069229 [Brassica napus]|uniref:AMP-dependent synthetase/ligase domain-containing protein n=1 Tax=Brassica napus TaxID=3708 RepID=A0ABQ7XEZ7_BRANA|nr:hypothetical protein HID58_069229 [Brassica napus]